MSNGVVRIDPRFRGPPTSGNGGYSAGLLALALGGSDCIVTLKQPPPLDTDLRIAPAEAGGQTLLHGDVPIATASVARVELAVPSPPTFGESLAAQARFTGFCDHNFPGCFVCGPERAVGDGLRIFPGRIGDAAGQVATTWTPDPSLADENGRLRPEFIWAALDCPGYYSVQATAGVALLGRIGAVIHRPVPTTQPLIVTGWPIASEGRKHAVGVALHDRTGALLAAALGTWITLRQGP